MSCYKGHVAGYHDPVITYVSLILTFLAVCRVTRLITDDYITLPVRQWLVKHNGETGWFTHGIHCPKCVSVWVGLGASPMWYFYGTRAWYVIPMVAMAFSYVNILLNYLDKG